MQAPLFSSPNPALSNWENGITFLFSSTEFDKYAITLAVHFHGLGDSTIHGARLLQHMLLNWNQEINDAALNSYTDFVSLVAQLFMTHPAEFGPLGITDEVYHCLKKTNYNPKNDNPLYGVTSPYINGLIATGKDMREMNITSHLNPIVVVFAKDGTKQISFGVGTFYNNISAWIDGLRKTGEEAPSGLRFTSDWMMLSGYAAQKKILGDMPFMRVLFNPFGMNFKDSAVFCKYFLTKNAAAQLDQALINMGKDVQAMSQFPIPVAIEGNAGWFVPNLDRSTLERIASAYGLGQQRCMF